MATSSRNPMRGAMDEGVGRPRRRRFQFPREVWGELSKVTWPTRQEATRLTWLVVIVSAVIGLFLSAWDYGLSRLAEWFLF